MKRFFLIIALFIFTQSIYAATEYATNNFYTAWQSSPKFSTQEAACSAGAQVAVVTAGTLQSAVVSYAGGGSNRLGVCYIKYTPFGQTGTGVFQGAISTTQTCPAGYTLGPDTTNIYQRPCTISTCPAGTTYNSATDKCVDNCAQYKDTVFSFALNGSTNTPSGQVCAPNNCAVNLTSVDFGCVATGCYGLGSGRYSGLACSGQPSSTTYSNPANQNPAPTDSPESACIKQGKSFGTVNGQTVCVSSGTSGAPPISQSSQTTTTQTNTDGAGNSTSQTTTQTQQVTSDGQNATVKTTKNNSDGTKSESSVTMPIDEFCKSNPKDKLCAGTDDTQSEFSGDCATNFSCSGDAVQCAMALQQHKIYCEAIADDPVRDDFLNEVTENTGKGLSDWIPQSVVNIPTDLTGQKLLASSCLPDMTFPISGHAFVLPISKLCPALEFCGTIVKIFSYLFSAIIIFGRRGS